MIDSARWPGGSVGDAAGHTVIERSVDAVPERDSDLVAGLSAEEREVLIPLLGKLEAFVRARSPSSS